MQYQSSQQITTGFKMHKQTPNYVTLLKTPIFHIPLTQNTDILIYRALVCWFLWVLLW